MREVALRSLLHDRGKLVGSIAGVALATTLVLVQSGIFVGLLGTASAMIRRTGGDVWVMGRGTEVLDNARMLPASSRAAVAAVGCAQKVRAVVFAVAPVIKPSGALDYVEVVGVEPGGPPVPWNLERGAGGDLDAPLRVAIDEHDREKLETKDDPMGGELDVGGQKAVVAGVTRGIRSFALYPYVFSNVENARKLAGAPDRAATFWVVDVDAPSCATTLRAALAAEKLDVHTTAAFADKTERYWVWGSGAGAAIAFSAVFSLIIGAIIVGQTLYSITREHLKELATLKAMGASPRELVSFVAWQAVFLGVVGGVAGLVVAASLRSALSSQGIEIVLSREVLATTAAAVAVMCAAASVPCVRKVLSVEAAEVFRVIVAAGVSKTFGAGALATPVLHDVSLEVRPGELVLLMGPSGSGKTTLVSILAGLMRASAGRVTLAGDDISSMSEAAIARIRRRRVGYVFQTYNLFPALTAEDNVAVAFRLRDDRGRDEARGAARDALAAVGLADRASFRPADLSSGQKQRVAIARALAGDPEVVIGDEPTAALDTANAMAVMELLRARVTPRTAMLLVTHDVRLEKFADRVVALEDGAIASPSGRSP